MTRFTKLALATTILSLTPALTSAQAVPDQPVEMGELKKSGKAPKPIKQGAPVYPYNMARAGLIGAVKVQFIIDKEGNVGNAYAVESNNPWFDRPAVDAIMAGNSNRRR